MLLAIQRLFKSFKTIKAVPSTDVQWTASSEQLPLGFLSHLGVDVGVSDCRITYSYQSDQRRSFVWFLFKAELRAHLIVGENKGKNLRKL